MILISDVHGCWYTLVRLLNQCAIRYPGDRLVFLGDLIDRGPHSRQVVEFAMSNNILTTMGNHCDLCVDFYRGDQHSKCGSYYSRGIWLENGGDVVPKGWPTIDKRVLTGPQIAQSEYLGGRVPDSVLDWMEALPPYIRFDWEDGLDANGRALLASHTGYGLMADMGARGWFPTLWGRHGHDMGAFVKDPATGEEADDGLYRVFGHTPDAEAIVTDKWAMIDTGGAYKGRGFGALTAFHWPSKGVVTQVFDETNVQARFEVKNGCILA